MKNAAQDPAVLAATQRLQIERDEITRREAAVEALRIELERAEKNLLAAEGRAFAGAAEPEEAENAADVLHDVDSGLSQAQRDLEVRRSALAIFERKVRDAETTARVSIIAELTRDYPNQIRQFARKLREAEEAAAAIRDSVKSIRANRIDWPAPLQMPESLSIGLLNDGGGLWLPLNQFLQKVERL